MSGLLEGTPSPQKILIDPAPTCPNHTWRSNPLIGCHLHDVTEDRLHGDHCCNVGSFSYIFLHYLSLCVIDMYVFMGRDLAFIDRDYDNRSGLSLFDYRNRCVIFFLSRAVALLTFVVTGLKGIMGHPLLNICK